MRLILNTILILCLGFFTLSSAITPKETVMINGVKATVWASSELKSKTPGRYSPKNLFDNDPATAWVEGVEGNGIDEWVTIKFETPLECDAISFDPGYKKSFALMRANALPDTIGVIINNVNKDVVFRYNKEESARGIILQNDSLNFKAKYYYLLDETTLINIIRIKIKSAVNGFKYEDLVISGIKFHVENDQYVKPLTTLREYDILLKSISTYETFIEAKERITEEVSSISDGYLELMFPAKDKAKKTLQEFYNKWVGAFNQNMIALLPITDSTTLAIGGIHKYVETDDVTEHLERSPVLNIGGTIKCIAVLESYFPDAHIISNNYLME